MAVKRNAVKRKPASKTNSAPPQRKSTAVSARYTKTQILSDLAENTGLSKQQVGTVLDELGGLIERHVKKRSCGEFVLPGMLKISAVKKPATKARKGINPFTGEETIFKAKPASTQIKVRPLSRLKSYAA